MVRPPGVSSGLDSTAGFTYRPLFLRIRWGGVGGNDPLAPRSIREIIPARVQQADIEGGRISGHSLLVDPVPRSGSTGTYSIC